MVAEGNNFDSRPTIFLSYCHADSKFVDQLAADLRRNFFNLFYDKEDILVGDSILNKLQTGIVAASFMVVILSPSSVKSRWVEKEWTCKIQEEIDNGRVQVFPALLRKCEMPLFIRDKKYADFQTDYDYGWKQLLSALESQTRGQQRSIRSLDPAMVAACKDLDVHALRELLRLGGDVNIKDAEGLTLLHIAVLRGGFSIVQALVEHGADIHAKSPGIWISEIDAIMIDVAGGDRVAPMYMHHANPALFFFVPFSWQGICIIFL